MLKAKSIFGKTKINGRILNFRTDGQKKLFLYGTFESKKDILFFLYIYFLLLSPKCKVAFYFKKTNSRSCTTTVLPSTLLDLSPVLTSDGASLRPAGKEREKRATPLESEATLPRSPTWRSVELGLPCTFCYLEENGRV